MSKNEFLDVVSVYLDELANNQGGLSDEKLKEIIAREIEGQLERYTRDVVLADDLDEKIDEALGNSDFVTREDLESETRGFMLEEDFDYQFDSKMDDCDFVESDDLDTRLEDYVTFDSLGDSIESALDERGVGALLDTLFEEVDYLKSRIADLELEKALNEIVKGFDALKK